MTVSNDEELCGLQEIGRIVANTLEAMGRALAPGMSTGALDALGRRLMEEAGARPAPELCYGFPGATCISVNAEIAHGIPGERRLAAGDLVNIDVSAEKDGFFADTGASFLVGPGAARLDRLCRDGRRAMWAGIRQARAGNRFSAIGGAIGAFARSGRYTLVRNLASHGVGRALHEAPTEIATWPEPGDRRVIGEGQVFTIEPFLSLGAEMAVDGGDEWTLLARPAAPTVQYEHTVVATRNGPLVVTLPG